MNKMREEFEKWLVAYWHQPNLTIDKYGYENEIVSQQWDAWKQAWLASRKALVVELPQVYDDDYGGHMSALSVEVALKDAGVRYK